VARVGKGEVHKWLGCGDGRKGDNFRNLGIEGRIILKWIFKTWNGEAWTVFILLKDRWAGVNVVMNFCDP